MSRDADIAAVRAAEQALYRAMITKDYAALGELLAPDLVYGHSTAVSESRDEYLAGVARGLYDYERIESRNVRVRLHGDIALQDGICDMHVGATDKPVELIHLLFVLVWTRHGNAWRLVHRHATRIPK